MEKTKKPPAEHIASLPPDIRDDIATLDQLISGIISDQPKVIVGRQILSARHALLFTGAQR